jgi:hypothetical protein
LVGAIPARAAPSRQSTGLTDQPTGQSSVSPEAAAAAVLTDIGGQPTCLNSSSAWRLVLKQARIPSMALLF